MIHLPVIDGLAAALGGASLSPEALGRIAADTQGFYDFKDLYDFCDRLRAEPGADEALRGAATAAMDAIQGMVIAEQHNPQYPDAHGVSIELSAEREGYRNLRFARDTDWRSAQEQISGAPSQAGRSSPKESA